MLEKGGFLDQEAGNIWEQAAAYINTELSEGKPAYKVRSLIREFPRPIVVDFNNVIANNSDPEHLNPDAPEALQELRRLGSIFVVSSAASWGAVQEFLVRNGVWYPDMILLASPNFEFLAESHRDYPQGRKFRAEFLDTAQRLGWEHREEDLIKDVTYKRVAPIFCKPYMVPLIDDSMRATKDNPGMLGIQVQTWEPNYNGFAKRMKDEINKDKPTLREAVEIVRGHYVPGSPSRTSEAAK